MPQHYITLVSSPTTTMGKNDATYDDWKLFCLQVKGNKKPLHSLNWNHTVTHKHRNACS